MHSAGGQWARLCQPTNRANPAEARESQLTTTNTHTHTPHVTASTRPRIISRPSRKRPLRRPPPPPVPPLSALIGACVQVDDVAVIGAARSVHGAASSRLLPRLDGDEAGVRLLRPRMPPEPPPETMLVVEAVEAVQPGQWRRRRPPSRTVGVGVQKGLLRQGPEREAEAEGQGGARP